MQKTAHSCNKQHPDIPPGYQIARCKHARIGQIRYAVIEAFNLLQSDEGIWCYSDVPSGVDGYSLICMVGYDAVEESGRKSLFNWLFKQMREGRRPLHFVMHCNERKILGIAHSPESFNTLLEYSQQRGSLTPLSGTMLYGRIPINERAN